MLWALPLATAVGRMSLEDAEKAKGTFEERGFGEAAEPAELLRRIERLEDEVMRLEDETQFLRRRLQREIEQGLDDAFRIRP